MKGTKILLVLVLGIFLAVAAYADEKVFDLEAVNVEEAYAFYDYRSYGTWTRTYEGGSEGLSGAYFQISIGVVLGGDLESYDDVIEVMAKHMGTGKKFFLNRSTCTKWIDKDIKYWYLFLAPENWMFQDTWRFIMIYKGSDDKTHIQIYTKEMGPVPFPMKPSHIKIVKEGCSSLILSWSAIGDPNTGPFDYRILIFGEDGCCVAEIKGDWRGGTGSYDDELNKVIFSIPTEWSRYHVRLENRIYTPTQWGRAFQFLQLPE